MINALSILIYLGAAYLIYRSVLKRRESLSVGKQAFLRALLGGLIPCTICIAVFELFFDRLFPQNASLGYEIFTAFLRAALIEEAFKLVFSNIAIKKSAPKTRIEYMLLCGMIGAGYGLAEKLAIGGGLILIVNALLPLHIFFQFLMGSLLYDAAQEDNKKKRLQAFLLPFLVHGLWDSFLGVAGFLLEKEAPVDTVGLILFAALIVGGIILEIKVVKRMNKTAA